MYPQLIIIEDDSELLSFYQQGFTDLGFTDIVSVENTENIVEVVTHSYTRPTLLLSDYYVNPTPPSRYLPELRLRGIEIPAVVVSGRIRAEQINSMTLAYPVRGFFEKSPQISLLIESIAKHLIDLGPEAKKSWEIYQLRQDVVKFIERMTTQECAALLRLLAMEEVKVIAAEVDIGLNAAYSLRKEMLAFLGKTCSPTRYAVLADELQIRIGRNAGSLS